MVTHVDASTPRYGASKRIKYPEFRTGIRLVQSVLSLAYLFMVVWSKRGGNYAPCVQLSSPSHCFVVIFDGVVYWFRLGIGLLSFMAASIFAEYSEQTRQFEFGDGDCLKLADQLFPAGIPESLTVMLSGLWVFNVAVANACPILFIPEGRSVVFLLRYPDQVFSLLHFAIL
ncbi:hypothetical protein L0F63_006360, partial [Massospora cicadina]